MYSTMPRAALVLDHASRPRHELALPGRRSSCHVHECNFVNTAPICVRRNQTETVASHLISRRAYHNVSQPKLHSPARTSSHYARRCAPPSASALGAAPSSDVESRWAAVQTFLYNQFVPIGLIIAILVGCVGCCDVLLVDVYMCVNIGHWHPLPVRRLQNMVYCASPPRAFSSYLDWDSSVARRSRHLPPGVRCRTGLSPSC